MIWINRLPLLDALPVPWLAIPGNHDIGDLGATSSPVDDRRRAAYQEAFGPTTWSVPLGTASSTRTD